MGLVAVFVAFLIPTFGFAVSWSSGSQLNTLSTDPTSYSQIVVDKDNNYLVFWRDNSSGAIYYKRFNWLTQSFETTQMVTTSSATPWGQMDSVFDCLRDREGVVRLFWLEGTATMSLNQRTTTDGVNWQPREIIRSFSGDLAHLSAASDRAGNLYLAYTEDEDLKLSVYGGSWTTTDVPDSLGGLYPYKVKSTDISADETGTASIVWRYYYFEPPSTYNARIRHIRYTFSSGFSSITDIENFSSSLPADEEYVAPNVVRDRSKIYAAWETNRVVYFAQSFNNGTTWTPLQALSSSSAGFLKPRLAVDRAGRLHLLWTEMSGSSASLYYRSFWNNKWSARETLVSESGVYNSSLGLAADRNANPLVAWSKAPSGGGSLFFLRGIDERFEIYKTSFDTTPTVTQPGSGWQISGEPTPTTWGESDYKQRTGLLSLWCAGTNNPNFNEHRYQPDMGARARYLVDMSGFADGDVSFWYHIPSADGKTPPANSRQCS